MKYVCQNCGDTVDGEEDWENWDCSYCGGRVVPEEESYVTPNEELRALVEQWREKQEDCTLPRSGLTGEGNVYRTCADELEEVLEDG